jgi:hypothetical protein
MFKSAYLTGKHRCDKPENVKSRCSERAYFSVLIRRKKKKNSKSLEPDIKRKSMAFFSSLMVNGHLPEAVDIFNYLMPGMETTGCRLASSQVKAIPSVAG